MARDDFTRDVIRRLRERVAHRCSNPGCRVSTIAAGASDDAVANVGKAAHITAASPKGPRYRSELTNKQRRSFENGIWLCSNCATKIDVDKDAYPVDLLQGWRREAEDRGRSELGRRQPAEEDAQNLLSTALSALPRTFVTSAIKNTHAATEKVLDSIDPRIKVKTSYDGEQIRYTLLAQEEIPFQLLVPRELAKEWSESITRVVERGHDAKIDASGVTVVGSPLFETLGMSIGTGKASLEVISPKQPALLEAAIVNESREVVRELRPFNGYVSRGTAGISFSGSGFNGFLAVRLFVPVDGTSIGGGDLTFEVAIESWRDRDLSDLPHLDRVTDIYRDLVNGRQIDIGVEVDGRVLLRGLSHSMASPEARDVFHMLLYAKSCQVVARLVGQRIPFRLNVPVSALEFEDVAVCAEVATGQRHFRGDQLKENPRITVIATDRAENIRVLCGESGERVLMIENPPRDINVMGTVVRLPPLQQLMHGVRPLVHVELSAICPGDEVDVELERLPEFGYSSHFKKES